MKVEYLHTEKPKHKYPWKQMRAVGDYFDVPPGGPAARGVHNSAYQRTITTRYRHFFRTFTLEDGTVRVMLVAVEPEAMAA